MNIILANWLHQCWPFLRRKIITHAPVRTQGADTKFLMLDSLYNQSQESLSLLSHCTRHMLSHIRQQLHTIRSHGHGKTMQDAILPLFGSKFTALWGKIYNTIRMYKASFFGSHNFSENTRKWRQTASIGIGFVRCGNKDIKLICIIWLSNLGEMRRVIKIFPRKIYLYLIPEFKEILTII